MKKRWMCAVAAGWMLGSSLCARATAWDQEAKQDKGYWQVASQTAGEITGDIAISQVKLSINFSRFPIAQIRELTPAEATAVFGESAGSGGGNLYRLDVPAEKRFAHRNTLCGEQETQWMVTWANGKRLQVAFFSGEAMPVLTGKALAQAQSVCELLTYAR